MVDFRERIEENDTSFERLRRMIPGFEGYHQREMRRTADRMLRDRLVQVLGEARSDLQRLMEDVARSARLARLNDLERVSKRLATASDQIRYADYGATGLFDAVQIREEALDRVYDYDESLMRFVDEVVRAARALAAAGDGDYDARLKALSDAVDELGTMVRDRENVFATLTP